MKRRTVLGMGMAVMVAPLPVFAARSTESFDVIVVGAGGAGLSAAIAAFDAGARVLVLEKMPVVGGNTQLAAGGMNAANTPTQAAKGVKDSWESMYEDTMKGGRQRNQKELVELMTRESANAVRWLTSLGAELPGLVRSGGAKVDRTLQPVGGPAFGPYITQLLFDSLDFASGFLDLFHCHFAHTRVVQQYLRLFQIALQLAPFAETLHHIFQLRILF